MARTPPVKHGHPPANGPIDRAVATVLAESDQASDAALPQDERITVPLSDENARHMDGLLHHLRLVKGRFDDADLDRMVAWYALEGVTRIYNQSMTQLAASGMDEPTRAALDALTTQPQVSYDPEKRVVVITPPPPA